MRGGTSIVLPVNFLSLHTFFVSQHPRAFALAVVQFLLGGNCERDDSHTMLGGADLVFGVALVSVLHICFNYHKSIIAQRVGQLPSYLLIDWVE